MRKLVDLVGKKFHKVTVLACAGKGKHGYEWYCVCDCGGFIKRYGSCIKAVKSCGCASYEKTNDYNITHGMSDSEEYSIWVSMKMRCLNPKHKSFKRYSSLGIEQSWIESFQEFFDHIGPRPSPEHSVGRIDNDKGYFKGNVRWETEKQQSQNKCMHSRNTSGVTGIGFATSGKRSYCRANWVEDLKNRSKYFSIDDLGLMPAFHAALKFRKDVIARLNESGCHYAPSHGL